MNKKQTSDIISAVIKTHKMNKLIKWETDELTRALKEIINNTSYSNYTDLPFKIKYLTVKGRRFKCIHLNSGTGFFPVTKKKLLNTKESKRAQVIGQLREAIEPQIKQFKESHKNKKQELLDAGRVKEAYDLATCKVTGKLLTKAHVDHVVPFIELADKWLEEFTFAEKFEDLRLTEAQLDSWRWYHQAFATLEIISAKANLKKNSGGYRSIH